MCSSGHNAIKSESLNCNDFQKRLMFHSLHQQQLVGHGTHIVALLPRHKTHNSLGTLLQSLQQRQRAQETLIPSEMLWLGWDMSSFYHCPLARISLMAPICKVWGNVHRYSGSSKWLCQCEGLCCIVGILWLSQQAQGICVGPGAGHHTAWLQNGSFGLGQPVLIALALLG